MCAHVRAHASAHVHTQALAHSCRRSLRAGKGDVRRSWGSRRRRRVKGGMARQGDRLSGMPSARKRGCYARVTGSLACILQGTQDGTPRREVLWHAACKRDRRETGAGSGLEQQQEQREGCKCQWMKSTTARSRGADRQTQACDPAAHFRCRAEQSAPVMAPSIRNMSSYPRLSPRRKACNSRSCSSTT